MRALLVLMLIPALYGGTPGQNTRPVSLPFTDGFENTPVGRYPGIRGWQVQFRGNHAGVTDTRFHTGKRSFKLESLPQQPRVEYVLLPPIRSRLSFQVSVFPDTRPHRVVRVGFPKAIGNVNRFYNFFQLHSRDGATGALFFKGHLKQRRVALGPFTVGKWITLRADLDFAAKTGTLRVNGKVVARDVPVAPRKFSDRRHGPVVLDRWGFGARSWRGRRPGVFFVDDVRIAGKAAGKKAAAAKAPARSGPPPLAGKAAGKKAAVTRAPTRSVPPTPLEKFVAKLRNPDPREGVEAAEALGKLGDRRALPHLRRVFDGLEDTVSKKPPDDPRSQAYLMWYRVLHCAVAAAMVRLGEKNYLTEVIAALGDEFPRVKGQAAWSLGDLGADAASAIPVLERALKDDVHKVREAASGALRKIRAAIRMQEKSDYVAILGAGKEPNLRLCRGNFWKYRVQQRGKTTVGKLEVTGVFKDGQIRVQNRNLSSDLGATLMWKPAGDFLIWEWHGFDWKVIQFGAHPKAKWTSTGKAFGPDLKLHSVVLAVEDVETPAGKFKDCLKIRTRLEDRRSPDSELHDMFQWWARGVGLVRLEVVEEAGVKQQ